MCSAPFPCQTETLAHTTDPADAAEALEALAGRLRESDSPQGARNGFIVHEPTSEMLCVYLAL